MSASLLCVVKTKTQYKEEFKHKAGGTIGKLTKDPTFNDITNLKTKLKENLLPIESIPDPTYGSLWLIANTSGFPNGPPNEVQMLANPGDMPVHPPGGTA